MLEAADRAFRLGFGLEYADIGFAALAKHGTTLPEGVLDRARAVDGIILGPISHLDYPPRDKGGVNVSGAFRVKLDLYANVRPARTRPGIGRTLAPMDLVIMRESTEGFYADRNMFAGSGEFMPTPDMALSLRKITVHACERIARRAFELARRRRRLVTGVHKANVFILTDGLFLKTTRAVAIRRRRRRTRPRSKTIAMKRLTREELRVGALMYPLVDLPRPTSREECRGEARPCPWVACKHHLYLDINPETGSIKINFPDLEPWELEHTCALDVADSGALTLEEIGVVTNLTRARVRQVEVRGLLALRARSTGLR